MERRIQGLGMENELRYGTRKNERIFGIGVVACGKGVRGRIRIRTQL